MRSRAAAAMTLAAGLALVVVAGVADRGSAPPLYDGVVVTEPYRWVNPPSGQLGDPGSFSQAEPVQNGTSPAFAAATRESPPQAQLLASQGAFAVPSGTAQLQVGLTPIAPPVGGSIVGNAYRISVTDASGAVIPLEPAAQVTIVLRAPAGTTGATIVRLVGSTWQAVPDAPAGSQDSRLATVGTLGVFAIQGTLASNEPSSVAITVGILVLAGLGGLLVLWIRGRGPSARPASTGSPRGRSRRRG
jgi:hypothetical protein